MGNTLLFAGGGSSGSKVRDAGGAGGIPDPTAGVQRTGRKDSTSFGIEGNLGGAAITAVFNCRIPSLAARALVTALQSPVEVGKIATRSSRGKG